MSYKSETLSITWNRVWMSFGAKSIVQRHGTCFKNPWNLKIYLHWVLLLIILANFSFCLPCLLFPQPKRRVNRGSVSKECSARGTIRFNIAPMVQILIGLANFEECRIDYRRVVWYSNESTTAPINTLAVLCTTVQSLHTPLCVHGPLRGEFIRGTRECFPIQILTTPVMFGGGRIYNSTTVRHRRVLQKQQSNDMTVREWTSCPRWNHHGIIGRVRITSIGCRRRKMDRFVSLLSRECCIFTRVHCHDDTNVRCGCHYQSLVVLQYKQHTQKNW